ncbi:amino acid adenylation domain-containing protein, partial [Tenacibaculum sp. 190524A02b]|uniref:amino acid adenylation domain-containing protein n=1 Tax=Tenacibaculum vairaonense TaxID=3137860 RepID=UPI0032B198CF
DKKKGDPYILSNLLSFKEKEKRRLFIETLQLVVNRHDVLRTCVISEDLPRAVQVVLREAPLSVEEIGVDTSVEILPYLEELRSSGNQWMDVSKAPLLTLKSVDDLIENNYYLVINQHHLVLDHVGIEKIVSEIAMHLSGKESSLLKPALYRDFIGHTLHSQAVNDSELYFKELLGTIEEPTYPFNLSNVQGDGSDIKEAKVLLSENLSKELREVSTNLGISPAVLFHAAYGMVIGTFSNSDYALFGSLFSGRLQGALGAADSLGLFINTLPFYISLDKSVLEYIKEVKQRLHELLPYEQTALSSVQEWSGVSSEVALFSALLNFRHSHVELQEEDKGIIDLGIEVIGGEERTNYPFVLNVDDFGVDFELTVQIDDSIEANRVLVYMQKALQELLRGLKSEEKTPVAALPLLPKEEEIQLLKTFNDTEVGYPLDQTVLDLFEEQVKNRPNGIAVVFKGEELSYKELDNRSNQLANYLLSNHNISRENIVGVVLDRSDWLIISYVSILKTGAAYVPIDPNYPEERKEYIQRDSSSSLIIDASFIEKFKEKASDYSKSLPLTHVNSSDVAYVIYTSGSTGQPKGVMVEHKNLLHLCFWHQSAYSLTKSSRGTLFAGIGFDASVWEIYPYLLVGASLYPISGEDRYDLNILSNFLKDYKITHTYIPTLLCESLIEEEIALPDTTILTGGDTLSINKTTELTIYNNYGPTEATVVATNYKVDDTSIPKIPIGKPIDNTQVYITNSAMNLVPVGVVGELCIGGTGVAKGYLNKEELTELSFVDNPFKQGDKLYKTGDLAKWLPDGNIEFIGRKDNQVKIRGYRIELGEIENALSNLETIYQSCVLAKEDVNGNKRLVGYIVTEGEFNKELTQEKLKGSLPDYMIPMIWIVLKEMPLTANGKLDRKSLPEPDSTELSSRKYVAPRNQVEKQLATIWKELLNIEQVGVYDNFFELGGHSLLATRLVSMIRKELQKEVTIQEVFQSPTIIDLALNISNQHKRALLPAIIAEDRPKHIPLSFSQDRLWFLDQLEGTIAYHIPTIISLEGRLDIAVLEQALKTIVSRHEVLRTVLYQEEGIGYQKVISPDNWSLQKVITSEEANLDKETSNFINHPFDLSKDYMLRSCLYDLGNEKYVLACVFHHIASDGWSENILISEFTELYSSLSSGNKADLPALNLQYADYAIWQRKYLEGEVLENQLTYWEEKLIGVSTLELPLDYTRPSIQSTEGARVSVNIDVELTNLLKTLCKEEEVTLFMVLLSAFKVLLSRYSGQEDICVGSPVANRTQSDLEGMIGFFVNTLALRSDLSGGISFKELLNQVKTTTLEGYDNQLAPFEKIVDSVITTRDNSITPLFQVLFVLQNATDILSKDKSSDIEALDISGYQFDTVTSKFDLTLDASENATGITLNLEYCTALFKEGTIEQMLSHYQELLKGI